jgi:predicted lipoprotein with Yx(FWY)xxD motif
MTSIRRRLALVALAAMAALSIFAVACGDDDDNGDDNGGASTPAATEPAGETPQATEPAGETPQATEPAGGISATIVTADAGDLGTILTTSDGYTLYTFDNDTTAGESACYDACASAWPPFPVADATVSGGDGEVGTITRTDGSPQTTYNGKPLYMYGGDAAPGDTNGEGVGGVWHVAKP